MHSTAKDRLEGLKEFHTREARSSHLTYLVEFSAWLSTILLSQISNLLFDGHFWSNFVQKLKNLAAEFKFSLLENQNKLRIYVFRQVVDKITNWVTVQSKSSLK